MRFLVTARSHVRAEDEDQALFIWCWGYSTWHDLAANVPHENGLIAMMRGFEISLRDIFGIAKLGRRVSKISSVVLVTLFAGVTVEPKLALSNELSPSNAVSSSSSFVQRRGTQFNVDGKPLFVTGVNTHYLSWSSDAETLRALDDAVALGANVIRTFLGTAIGDAAAPQTDTVWNFNTSAGDSSDMNVHGRYLLSFDHGIERVNEGASGLGRIDFLLAEAHKRKLKVILILTDFWKYGGGVPQMVAWRKGPQNDPGYTAFFLGQDYREDYLKLLEIATKHVNRLTGVLYRDDPTIFAWELMNEPQTELSVRNGWLADMSHRLKGLDPNHLIATGEDHLNISDFLMPSIDFVTWHGYPKYYGITPEKMDDVIKQNCRLASIYQKPVLLEEFGLKGANSDPTKAAIYGRWLEILRGDRNCSGWLVWRLVSKQNSGNYPSDPVEGFDVVRDGGAVWNAVRDATAKAHSEKIHAGSSP